MRTGKMQNYIVESKRIYIGLEDSKATWKVAVRSEKLLIHEASMPAKYPDLIGYIRNKFPACSVSVIYEAGFHGFWLHDLLVADGIACVVVPPHTVTEEKTNRVKTDRIDARRLSQNLENKDYKKCWVPDADRRADRQISRTLEDVQQNITRTRNQIWKMFDFHGISGFARGAAVSKKEIRALHSLDVPEMIKVSLTTYLVQLECLWKESVRLRTILRSLTKKEKYRSTFEIIHSAPGIGWFTAIRLVLEWGEDFTRFANRRTIAGFLGLSGSEYSTGETVRRGSLTGLGHKRSRSWLVECSWVSIRKDPVLLDKFKRVLRNTGSKKKAIVAVARKLSGRLLRCVLSKQLYHVGLVAEGCNA